MTPPQDDPFADLQLRGIAAASAVFDQLAAELGGTSAAGTEPGPAPAGDTFGADDPVGRQQLRAAAARTIDLFAGLLQQTFESYVELVQEIVQPSAGPGGSTSAPPRSDLELIGPPGGNAVATIWIHNATDRRAADVVLRLTDLTDHACARIDASLARFLPSGLSVDARASAPSMLSLAIPPRTEPGVYFGHVLAAGLPAAALAVRLVVEDAP